jgi:hypothetical protein
MRPLCLVHGEEKVGVVSRYSLHVFNVLSRTGFFTLRTRRIATGGGVHGALRILSLSALMR